MKFHNHSATHRAASVSQSGQSVERFDQTVGLPGWSFSASKSMDSIGTPGGGVQSVEVSGAIDRQVFYLLCQLVIPLP
jgi:hypothetical protein